MKNKYNKYNFLTQLDRRLDMRCLLPRRRTDGTTTRTASGGCASRSCCCCSGRGRHRQVDLGQVEIFQIVVVVSPITLWPITRLSTGELWTQAHPRQWWWTFVVQRRSLLLKTETR